MSNLLNSRFSDKDGKMQSDILDILSKIGISSANMKIAQKFFDFSSDMDLSLIENNVEFQDLSAYNNYSSNYHVSIKSIHMVETEDENDFKYTDRYILFLDALGKNTIYGLIMMPYDPKKLITMRIKSIWSAFSKKYDNDMIKKKLMAIVAEKDRLDYGNLSHTAKENRELLLDSVNCCFGKYQNAKFIFYTLAFAYNGYHNTSYISESEKNEALNNILNIALNSDIKDKKIFSLIMSGFFMAVNYSEKIEKYIKENISGREKEFLEAILKQVPNYCIENNVEKLFEIIDISEPDYLSLLMQNGYRFNVLLDFIAEKFPEKLIEVMYSTKDMNVKYYGSVLLCNYYERIYNVIKNKNPKLIEDYNINFEADILKLSILTEQKQSGDYGEKVGKYFRGEADISILLPDVEALRGSYKWYNSDALREKCMEINPDFKRRYIAYSAVWNSGYIRNLLLYNTKFNIQLQEIIHILIAEKVPIDYRFNCYQYICDYAPNNSKRNFEDEILKIMVSQHEKFYKEYDEYYANGGVFSRNLYLQYLELSNDKNDKNKEKILAVCLDSSKEVRGLAVEIVSKHKEYESDIIEMLKSKKQASRESAVDILSVWGAENYKDILTSALNSEKSAKLADKIRNILNMGETLASGNSQSETTFSPVLFIEKIHKGGKNKKILWLYETPNYAVHFNNGTEADDKYMQAIMLCYSNMTKFSASESADLLAKDLNQNELNQFASGIFSKWINDGAESKKKWVLYFYAIHGGSSIIEVLQHYIKEWSEASRGAIAAEAVKAMILNGSSEALMTVDNIAHKFKHKQVKSAAVQALDDAAEILGITSDELGDRIVPDLGFDENMERIFDYGTRKFKVCITPSLELEVYDENDKKLKTLPAPSKKDDEETAKQSNAEFKQMKKLLKNIVSIQKSRLETALLADRRWSKTAWNDLFVKNPVMHSFAIGLIWSAYENDELIQTFRYMEDGSFNTSDEDEYELPDNCTVGLAHPIDLDEDTLAAWKEQLSDYEIAQPVEQLERKVYRINDDEIGKFDLLRFNGKKIAPLTLLGRMTKFGWYKGSVKDGGCFDEFYREDVTRRIKDGDKVILKGNAVELTFSGMDVGGYYSDGQVTIEKVRFYAPGTIQRGSYVYDNADDKSIKLEKINPRYFSEIVNQLEMMLKDTEN